MGLGVALIPGIGPVMAAGPLAAGWMAGIGAAAGAAAGGIVASLVDFGIPEEEANIYAENIRRGGTLVAVEVDENRVSEAQTIMNRYNPIDLEESGSTFRTAGWTAFDEHTLTPDPTITTESTYRTTDQSATRIRPVVSESPLDEPITLRDAYTERREEPVMSTGASYADYENRFRTHFNTNYGSSGYTYDQYSPAYRYGYTLATNDRFNTYSDWTQVEPEARRYWEERNPNTWERFKDTIRDAWYEVTGRK